MMEVKIDGWQKGIRFSSAHATPELGKCERLHGHTYAIHAVLSGSQNDLDIVYDFTDITNALRGVADEIDHKVLVPMKSKRVKVRVDGGQVHMETALGKYLFPRGDCALLPTQASTAEELCKYVLGELRRRVKFPANLMSVRLGVDEGYGQGAWTQWTRNGSKGGRFK